MVALPRIIFSLKPEDLAKLDEVGVRFEADSRSQALRKLIRDAAKEKLK
jgi:metal-responsive CopG/Arc/MetJ family transcriptional regulator